MTLSILFPFILIFITFQFLNLFWWFHFIFIVFVDTDGNDVFDVTDEIWVKSWIFLFDELRVHHSGTGFELFESTHVTVMIVVVVTVLFVILATVVEQFFFLTV